MKHKKDDFVGDNIYAPLPGVKHSDEGIRSCLPSYTKLFSRIEHSGIRLREM